MENCWNINLKWKIISFWWEAVKSFSFWNHVAPMPPSCVTTKYVKIPVKFDRTNCTSVQFWQIQQLQHSVSYIYVASVHFCNIYFLRIFNIKLVSLSGWDLILNPTKRLDKLDANINLYGQCKYVKVISTLLTPFQVAFFWQLCLWKNWRFNSWLQFIVARRCCSVLVGN